MGGVDPEPEPGHRAGTRVGVGAGTGSEPSAGCRSHGRAVKLRETQGSPGRHLADLLFPIASESRSEVNEIMNFDASGCLGGNSEANSMKS